MYNDLHTAHHPAPAKLAHIMLCCVALSANGCLNVACYVMRCKLVVSISITEPSISVQFSSSQLTASPSYLQASILPQHISPLLLSGHPVNAKL